VFAIAFAGVGDNIVSMSLESLLSLVLFSFVSSITPGPNNMMLMASGSNFGFRKTLPHMLGVSFGFSFMLFLVGLGVAGVLQEFPAAQGSMKVAGVAYMLWLAWKIARASAPGQAKEGSRPMTFRQAVLFQWLNPKAWSMSLTAVALYSPSRDLHALFLVACIFLLVNFPSVSSWAYLGQNIRFFLSSPARLRAFNWGMALLLVGSLAFAM
jgi:threonine/homoserine/homoserine lactone efflux protein